MIISGNLVQIFDLNIEGKIQKISGATDTTQLLNKAYKKIYDDPLYKKITGYDESHVMKNSGFYLYGAPWTVNPESVKKRIDLFVSGTVGIIGDSSRIDYQNNAFARSLKALKKYGKNDPDMYHLWTYEEEFINYSYSGEFTENDDGDILVTGAQSKDKIVIIYTLVDPGSKNNIYQEDL